MEAVSRGFDATGRLSLTARRAKVKDGVVAPPKSAEPHRGGFKKDTTAMYRFCASPHTVVPDPIFH